MSLIHEDSEFGELIQIVAKDLKLGTGLVEKDYWVTHSLWALSRTRMDIWFKGGTSLSKGFNLIERFSEDLDLRIERGHEETLPKVTNWKSSNKGPIAERRAFYDALEDAIAVSGAVVKLDREAMDQEAREANYQIQYPGKFLQDLHRTFRPFVLLEVGTARVTPFIRCSLSSFVHDWLKDRGELGNYDDNLPREIRCVHPLVTLLEKLDAITRRFPRGEDPAPFIRHYEDSARIIQAEKALPDLDGGLTALIKDMIAQRQIQGVPSPDNPAFAIGRGARRTELEEAYKAIAPMFWGKRLSFQKVCEIIRHWLKDHQ